MSGWWFAIAWGSTALLWWQIFANAREGVKLRRLLREMETANKASMDEMRERLAKEYGLTELQIRVALDAGDAAFERRIAELRRGNAR